MFRLSRDVLSSLITPCSELVVVDSGLCETLSTRSAVEQAVEGGFASTAVSGGFNARYFPRLLVYAGCIVIDRA